MSLLPVPDAICEGECNHAWCHVAKEMTVDEAMNILRVALQAKQAKELEALDIIQRLVYYRDQDDD